MTEIAKYFDFWGSVWQPFLNFYNDWMIWFGFSRGYQTPDLLEHISCPKDPYFSPLADLNVEMGFQGNAITNATLASYEKTALQYGSYISGLPNQEELSNPLEKLVSSSLRERKRQISPLVHPDKVAYKDKATAEKLTALKNALYDELDKKIQEAGYYGLKIEQTPKVKELLGLSKLAGEIWPIVCKDVKEEAPEARKIAWPFSTLEKPLSDNSKKEILEFLFNKGVSVNAQNPEGKTVLIAAIDSGESEEIIEFILDKKPDLSLIDKGKNSALMAGIKKRLSLRVIDKLINEKNVNQANYENTPFGLALEQGNLQLAKLLLKAGADPKKFVSYEQHPLIQFLNNPRLLDNTLLQQLLEKGVDPKNAEYQTSKSLLASAIQENMSIKTLLDLVKAGAKPTGKASDGNPVLVSALKMPGYEKVALELIKVGADYQTVDQESGETVLEIAANKALERNAKDSVWQEIVQAILNKGAYTHHVFKSGDNLLNVMTRLEWPEKMTCQAIKQGADVNHKGSKDDYPFLTFLSNHGFEESEALGCFLSKEIDVNAKSKGKAIIDILLDELEKSSETKTTGVLDTIKGVFSSTKSVPLEKIQHLLTKMQDKVLDGQDYGRLILKSVELSLDEKFIGDLVQANHNVNYQNAHGLTIPLALLQKKYDENTLRYALEGFNTKVRPGFGGVFLKSLLEEMVKSKTLYSEDFLEMVLELPGIFPEEVNETVGLLKQGINADLSEQFVLKLIKSLPENAFKGDSSVFSEVSAANKEKWLQSIGSTYFEGKEAWLVSSKKLNEAQLNNFHLLMKQLLEGEVNPNVIIFNGKPLAESLLVHGMADLLPDAYWTSHPNWKKADKDGNTLLLQSIKKNAGEEFIDKLVDLGVDVTVVDKNGHTALAWLISNGYRDWLIDKFISKGAVFGVKESVYYYRDGLLATFGVFCGGALIHAFLTRKNDGWKPIHYAAKYNGEKSLKRLIEKGNDINMLTKGGETPLAIAIKYNNLEAINFLVRDGAIANAQLKEKTGPHKGWTLTDFAWSHKNPIALQYLSKLGAVKSPAQSEEPLKTLLHQFKPDFIEDVSMEMPAPIQKDRTFEKVGAIAP